MKLRLCQLTGKELLAAVGLVGFISIDDPLSLQAVKNEMG